MSTALMTSCKASEVLHWHQQLRDYLRDMEKLHLAAVETGQEDAWQFRHDEASAQQAALEEHYPHLKH